MTTANDGGPADDQAAEEQLRRDLAEQVQQLGEWNQRKDSDESWRQDAEAVRASNRVTKERTRRSSSVPNAFSEILAGVFARLAWIGASITVVALVCAGFWLLRGKVHAGLPNGSSNSATELASGNSAGARKIAQALGKSQNNANAVSTATNAAINAATATTNSAGQQALPRVSNSNAASPSANSVSPSINPPNGTPHSQRGTHSPELMAQLQSLWTRGGDAKHRGDYAGARKAWSEALRLCPGHPGFGPSLAALPQ